MSPAARAPRLAGWARGNRALLGIGLFCVAMVVVLTVTASRSRGHEGDLDPQSPAPDGAQALARVLTRHGVAVTVVRRAADLRRARIDRDTTVVVTSTGNLGTTTARQVERRAAHSGALVLAAPGPAVLRTLGLPLSASATSVATSVAARCRDHLLSDLTLDVDSGLGYRATTAGPTRCFSARGTDPVSLVVRVDRPVSTYAVGGARLFANQRISRADNAAAALRLLGQHDRLVWYVPDLLDVAAGDPGSPRAQLPGGLLPALWLVGAAVLATLLWRGRRLGPLAVERLPVVVKAVESTQGRGRLYRRVRDQAHAAEVLRRATTRRLAGRLRLPAGTDPGWLAQRVAETVGADPGVVHDLLAGRPVTDDAALTRLAADLAALEREVHDA